jgi:hypothetical protein
MAGEGKVGFVGLLFFILFGVCCFLVWVVGTLGPMYQGCTLNRCPASALICNGPGLLGDASGNFSLVVASENVSFVSVVGFIWVPLC